MEANDGCGVETVSISSISSTSSSSKPIPSMLSSMSSSSSSDSSKTLSSSAVGATEFSRGKACEKGPIQIVSVFLPDGIVRSFLMPRSPIRFPGEVDDVEEGDGIGIGTVAPAAVDCKLLPPRFLRRPCKANGIPDLGDGSYKLQFVEFSSHVV